MNRNSFLKASFAIGAFLSAPFIAVGKINRQRRIDKAIKVDAGKDRLNKPISLFEGDTFTQRCLQLTRMVMYMYLNQYG